jgi:Phosphotransferase enzyme family
MPRGPRRGRSRVRADRSAGAVNDEREVPLRGGHLSAVVRAGDTVRRPSGPWTPAVHALLAHLERGGFRGAPRVHGLDARGREVLSFVPGDVPRPQDGRLPAYVWSRLTLTGVARLLADYHRVVARFRPPPDARWQTADAGPDEAEVICHNDIAPWNTVFSDGVPTAVIDWDLAGPGRRMWDLAYALWHFVPLYERGRCAAVGGEPSLDVRAERVAEFCRVYGRPRAQNIVEAVVARQLRARARIRRLAEQGQGAFPQLWQSGIGDAILRDAEFVQSHSSELARLLARPDTGAS